MIVASNIALMVLAIAFCVPVAMFCLEVLLALLPRRGSGLAPLPEMARVAVLIPAHDEAAVIGATLRTLIPTIPSGGQVLVVADNCTDATANIVRQCGADVIERQDTVRRGKGFALDFGIQHLAKSPPDAVVFLDADCRVGADTVRLLAAAAIGTGQPVQGLNLCDPDPRGVGLQMISGLAFRFKNLVATLGLVRLAGLNHLSGTGMALPWPLLKQVKLADGNVVEDMQLGIELALAGKPPLFLPEARVDSPLPQQRAAARTQRTRWEHGHLKTLIAQCPRLLGLAIQGRRIDLVWLALDLAIPPLALLVVSLASCTAVAAIAFLIGASALPLAVLALALTALATAVIAGWAVFCRKQVPLVALLAAPLYIAAKLPIYLAFLVKRQQHWIRTERDPGAAKPLGLCLGMFSGPEIVTTLEDLGVTHVIWVPDSATGPWEEALEASNRLTLVRVCREGEAWPLAGGLLLGGKTPLVIMQTTGLFESGDALRNVVFDLKLPVFALIGVRNGLIADSRDSAKVFAEPIVQAWGLDYVWIREPADKQLLAAHFLACRAPARAGAVLMAEGPP